MNLNAPKKITWLIALVLGVLGLLGGFGLIPALGGMTAFYLEFVAFALLALATYFPML